MRVRDVIERSAALYNDLEYVRLPIGTYLDLLDDAIVQLILSRPDSHVAHRVVKLIPGTQQTIPEDCFTLIDIYMNKKRVVDPETGVEQFLNYRPIWQVQRRDLDYYDNWQGTIRNLDYINEFAYDERSPLTYWVTPFVGDNSDVYIEMDCSFGVEKYGLAYEVDPTILDEIMNREIPISDTFFNPIVSYVLYLLYSTDSTSAMDREIAARYEASFYQALGLEYNAVNIVKPKLEDHEVASAIREGS